MSDLKEKKEMGKKVESNFINMVGVLFVITLIASAAVGYVFSLTEGTIADAQAQKEADAIKSVIPTEFESTDKVKVATDIDSVEVFYAKKDGEIVGTAVKSFTKNGFGGTVDVMVGFDNSGKITGYSVLTSNETPGLGSKMGEWFTATGKGNVIGKTPGTEGLKVKKDGGDVDAITAATISSRAFCDAINRAANVVAANNSDATSGATSKVEESSENNGEIENELEETTEQTKE